MLSKSANPSLATPSQAPRGEGVETGREPPDRVMAQVKAQSRPRTLRQSSGGESRSGMGSGESWFEPRRGNFEARPAARVGLRSLVGSVAPSALRPRRATWRTSWYEPGCSLRSFKFDHGP